MKSSRVTINTAVKTSMIFIGRINSMVAIFCLLNGLGLSHSLSAAESQDQCMRSFDYSIFLRGFHTGSITRIEDWQGKSANITSISEASILGIGTQYQQRTELSWSDVRNEWLTDNFHQQVSGFRSRDLQVTFDNNGLRSRVNLDGEVTTYLSKIIPLRDVDTLTIQIRENIISGRRQFALKRQASDTTEAYQFYVQEPLIASVGSWGEIELIPVEQTGAEQVTYYFAPSLNHQLVKAQYHGIILQGIIELDSYVSTCGY